MRFEWDDRKSELNEEKHGVPLDFGCDIWHSRVVTLRSNKRGEKRKISFGMIGGECWAVVWEDKGDTRRLISVRLATRRERSFYDSNDN